MMGDRSRLKNFVKKFIKTVRFRNDHFDAIMGYGDYVIGDSVISKKLLLLLVTPKTDPLFTLIISKPYMSWCMIRSLILPFSESLVLFVTLQMTVKILENYNQQLILEYSLVMHQAGKVIESTTKEPRIMETIHVQFDELTKQMAPVQLSTGPTPTFMTPGQISSGLVPTLIPVAPYVPPTNKELEILFQPMFDEYLDPPRIERPVSPALAVSVLVNSDGTPSSTTIDQDAPSPSHSPSSSALQSPSLHQGVVAKSTIREDNPFATVDNDSFINVFAPQPSSEASSSRDLSSAESPYVT
ncbi:hypothetical protein Tco_1321452 [Tanacetum coccineum]